MLRLEFAHEWWWGNSAAAQAFLVVPDDVAALGRYIYGAAEGLRSALKSASAEPEAPSGVGR